MEAQPVVHPALLAVVWLTVTLAGAIWGGYRARQRQKRIGVGVVKGIAVAIALLMVGSLVMSFVLLAEPPRPPGPPPPGS